MQQCLNPLWWRTRDTEVALTVPAFRRYVSVCTCANTPVGPVGQSTPAGAHERKSMKIKMTLLALSAVAAAMFALPSVASAGEWEISEAGAAFTITGVGKSTLTTAGGGAAADVTCTSTSGAGKYVPGSKTTTEDVTLTYAGCTTAFGIVKCTTGTDTAGTITTTALTGHNIMLEATPTSTMGILLTPNGTHFTTFVCAGKTIVVTGNGVIGEVEIPCTKSAGVPNSTKEFPVKYESTATRGTQRWMHITTSGTTFDLDTTENGGAAATASLDSTDIFKFANTQTITCP
jgi:hypothetical protein